MMKLSHMRKPLPEIERKPLEPMVAHKQEQAAIKPAPSHTGMQRWLMQPVPKKQK